MTKILCFLGILLSVSLCVQSWGMYLSWLYIPWVFFIITAAFIAYNIGSEVYLKEFYLRPSIICLLSLLIVGFQLSIDDVLGYSSLNSTIFSGASEYADQAFFRHRFLCFHTYWDWGKVATYYLGITAMIQMLSMLKFGLV